MSTEVILNKGDFYNGKEISAGYCPKCGKSEHMRYEDHDFVDNFINWKWYCDKCDCSGLETFRINFVGHTLNLEN